MRTNFQGCIEEEMTLPTPFLLGCCRMLLPVMAWPFVDHRDGAQDGRNHIRLKLRFQSIISRIYLTTDTDDVFGLQVGWNVILWPLAIYVFKKSEERMISYGG